MFQAALDSLQHPDLRRKLLFTFGILIIFRLLAMIPLPGVNPDALRDVFEANAVLGMLDTFSGGAMERLGLVAMGVYPYITASIVMTLLVPIIPRLQMIAKEGEEGRNKINRYTHYLMVPLAMLQGYGQLMLINRTSGIEGDVIEHVGLTGSDLLPTAAMVLTLTAGTVLLVWLGELITERGIGNGISIIIFAGIVADMPDNIGRAHLTIGNDGVALLILLFIVIAFFIVFVMEAFRRIPVQYSRSTFRGGRVYRQSGGTHIPLRVNATGMIPLIFAMSVMVFPGTIASYFMNGPGADPNFANRIYDLFNSSGDWWWFYWGGYFLLVIGFTLFYATIMFQQQNLPEMLQKQGGFIPGIRPGKPTADYLNGVQSRLAWGGAIFLGLVAIMPLVAMALVGTSINTTQNLMIMSSAGILIAVGVVLDTMRQMEAQLLMRHYEGFIK
ncbi:MAG: preprotein translocase subunit SecY [Chloroflexi bacterium]|nr:preprotein translocase subunit SecY [Chloroflexota bacterium]